MMNSEIKVYINEHIRKKYAEIGTEFDGIDGDESLTTSGLFDSMEFFGLITDIEEHFDVEIAFDGVEPDKFTTVNGLLSCVSIRRKI